MSSRTRQLVRASALLLTAFPVLACGPSTDRSGSGARDLTREEFVDAVVAIREGERALLGNDSAAALFEDRKAEILQRHGVTEEDLRAFLAAHRDDVAMLQELWDSVSQRLRYLPESAAGDSAGVSPGEGRLRQRPAGDPPPRRGPEGIRPAPDDGAAGVRRLH